MNDYAVVLLNDSVYRSSNFGGIDKVGFTKNGKISRFVFNNIEYMAIFAFGTQAFLDYVERSKFLKLIEVEKRKKGSLYTGVDIRLWKNDSLDITFKRYSDLVLAIDQDVVYGILRDDGLCLNRYTWKYTMPYNGPINPEFAPGYDSTKKFLCESLESSVHAQKIYNQFKDYEFYDLETGRSFKDPKLVAEVAILIKNTSDQMMALFSDFIGKQGKVGVFVLQKNEYGSYSREQLLDYKNGLMKWKQIYAEHLDKLRITKDDVQLYIIFDTLFRYNMLDELLVDQKIAMLKVLCENGLKDWYFANSKVGFQQRESLAVKIIQSVTSIQASEFLSKLISIKVAHSSANPFNSKTNVTFYKLLFKTIDDFFGPANFTAFVKALRDLVLYQNGIDPSPKLGPGEVPNPDELKNNYTPEQLQRITKANFFWGADGNKNKVKYEVVELTDTRIKLEESVFSETVLEERYYPNTYGYSANSVKSYIETVKKPIKKKMDLAHFDLVSIHFYENPSFVDTTIDPTYIGRNFLTFAGFIDYLKEKEHTKLVLDILNNTMLVISMTVGFGEIVIALRSHTVAGWFVGAMITVGDGSVFLATNIPFREYIKETFPENYNLILDALLSAGGLASLGGGAATTGIIGAYSKKDTAKILATGEYILSDAEAVAKLTVNDIKVLREGLDRFDHASFSIKSATEFIKNTKLTVGELKFYRYAGIRTELTVLSEPLRMRFFEDFGNASREYLAVLDEHSHAISTWSKTQEEGLDIIKGDKDYWLKSYQHRSMLLNKDYGVIAQFYGKNIAESITIPECPGVRWIGDNKYVKQSLIDQVQLGNDSTDIAKIAANYDIPVHVVERVKQHYFIEEHFMFDYDDAFRFGRFQREATDITEWKNAITKELKPREVMGFKTLIAHEYLESRLMEKGMNFRSFKKLGDYTPASFGAHELCPLLHDASYVNLFGGNPPALVFESIDFSILEDIIDFYVDFYKL